MSFHLKNKKNNDLDQKNKKDYHDSAKNNNFEIIFNELKKNKNLINSIDERGNTFFHYALINKNFKAIAYLFNIPNINFNLQNSFGDAPLHLACYNLYSAFLSRDKDLNYYFEIVILLLNKGAKKFMLNCNLKLPFDYLNGINNYYDSSGDTLLHIALKNSNLIISRFMVEELNFSLNTKNNNGETPVHLSVFNAMKNFDNIDYFNFLNVLYNVGYDENIKDNYGLTAGNYLLALFI